MKTVAIYGFSPRTRAYINSSNADEVWTLNNAYKPDYAAPLERVTRWYELHQDWQIFSGNITQEHLIWLQDEHEFPIYMIDSYAEFPASVKFPKDVICQYVDGNREYMTNSIAWMIGHALYEGFDRIELYGVDLMYGTEYSYQKAGTEYMIGIAIGKLGADGVYLPPGCALLDAPLYGYDAHTQTIHRDTLEEHRAHYEQLYETAYQDYAPLLEKYNSGDKSVLPELLEMNPALWRYDGAQAVVRMLIETRLTGDWIGRQALERLKTKTAHEMSAAKTRVNYSAGMIAAYQELGINNQKSQELLRENEQHQESLHVLDGQVQALIKLINQINFRTYDMDLPASIGS